MELNEIARIRDEVDEILTEPLRVPDFELRTAIGSARVVDAESDERQESFVTGFFSLLVLVIFFILMQIVPLLVRSLDQLVNLDKKQSPRWGMSFLSSRRHASVAERRWTGSPSP